MLWINLYAFMNKNNSLFLNVEFSNFYCLYYKPLCLVLYNDADGYFRQNLFCVKIILKNELHHHVLTWRKIHCDSPSELKGISFTRQRRKRGRKRRGYLWQKYFYTKMTKKMCWRSDVHVLAVSQTQSNWKSHETRIIHYLLCVNYLLNYCHQYRKWSWMPALIRFNLLRGARARWLLMCVKNAEPVKYFGK